VPSDKATDSVINISTPNNRFMTRLYIFNDDVKTSAVLIDCPGPCRLREYVQAIFHLIESILN